MSFQEVQIPAIVREVFAMPEFQHFKEQAQVLLDVWGQELSVTSLLGGDFALQGYVPPKVVLPPQYQSKKGVFTVLSSDVKGLRELEGYRIYATFMVHDKECPALNHTLCPLCGGSKIVTWGDDWRVVVLVPDDAAGT